jgi:hypothetical protein
VLFQTTHLEVIVEGVDMLGRSVSYALRASSRRRATISPRPCRRRSFYNISPGKAEFLSPYLREAPSAMTNQYEDVERAGKAISGPAGAVIIEFCTLRVGVASPLGCFQRIAPPFWWLFSQARRR